MNPGTYIPLIELEATINLQDVVGFGTVTVQDFNCQNNSTNFILSMPNIISLLGSDTGSNSIMKNSECRKEAVKHLFNKVLSKKHA